MAREDFYQGKVKEFKNGKIILREYAHPMDKPKKEAERRLYETKKELPDKQKEISPPKLENGEQNCNSGTIEKRNLARTRRTIIELIENNEELFETFITLTFKDEVEDIDIAYRSFRSFVNKCRCEMKKQKAELHYLAIPEIQKKRAERTGRYVVHFHLITNIPIDSVIIPRREPKMIKGSNKKGVKIIEYYDIKYWAYGYSIAIPITRNGSFSLSKYLIKYLYKDMDDRFFGRQKILHDNGLDFPKQYYLQDYEDIEKMKEENKESIVEMYTNTNDNTEDKTVKFTEYTYKKE